MKKKKVRLELTCTNTKMLSLDWGVLATMLDSYQNSECQSYEVMLKAGCRGCGKLGVMGSAGAYYIGSRTQPQLIGCALTQEPGVLNFGLRVANNGGRQICGDKRVIGLCFSQLQTEV